jgi:hypothetical protein
LFNYQGLKDTDNVLFLDPDMVFLKPITQTVTQGTIIGQKWGYGGVENWGPFVEYGSHIKNKLKEYSIFMYPYIATVWDMKKIINRYTSLCYQMRLDKYPHLWESDMFALVISTLENEINIKTIDNLGFCLPWINESHYQNNNDVINSSIIHYPGTIEDINKERIFNKQYYTSQTKNFHWDRIDFNSAITNIERKFLHILDTYNLSKLTNFYWNDCELLDSLFGYKAEDKYLVFRPWSGGWNNIRMSLEIAACVAFLQNRILVLPPEYRMYLLKNTNSMSTFFDISDLGIETISFEELCLSGNTYACTKIKQIDTSTPTIIWPKNLIEYRDYQNPRFDFFNEDAKKADTLHKLLSVVKNDFRYRKIISGNIVGEKWYFTKINNKPIEIYTLKSIQLDELEFGFIETNFSFLGVFANKKYFKFNNVYVVLIGHNATFYYLI